MKMVEHDSAVGQSYPRNGLISSIFRLTVQQASAAIQSCFLELVLVYLVHVPTTTIYLLVFTRKVFFQNNPKIREHPQS